MKESEKKFPYNVRPQFGGGGGGVRWPRFFDHLAYVRVSWSNGQTFLTMNMAKISKLPWSNGQKWPFLTMTMTKIQELPWSNGQNWSIWPLTMDKIEGVMVMVNFFDHRPWGKFKGVMVMVSALPPPPQFMNYLNLMLIGQVECRDYNNVTYSLYQAAEDQLTVQTQLLILVPELPVCSSPYLKHNSFKDSQNYRIVDFHRSFYRFLLHMRVNVN